MEQSDLKLRRNGFMERSILCCPFPKKMMYEEVISANDNFRSTYSPDAQTFKKLLQQIFNYRKKRKKVKRKTQKRDNISGKRLVNGLVDF